MNSNPNQPVFLIPSNVQRPVNISNTPTSSLTSNLTSQSPRTVQQQQMSFANGTKKITILTSTSSNIPRGATTRIIRPVEGMTLPMKTQIPIVTKTTQIPILTTTGSRMPIRLVPMTSIPNVRPQTFVTTVQQSPSPRTIPNIQPNAIPEGVRVALISPTANSLSPKSAKPVTSSRMISIPVQAPISHPKVIAFNPQASRPQISPRASTSGQIRTVYIAKECLNLQSNGSSSTRMTSSRPALIPMTSTGPTMTSGMTPTMTHTVTPTMTPAMSTLTPTPTMKTQTDSAKILTPDEFKMTEVPKPDLVPKLQNETGNTENPSISLANPNEIELSNRLENEPIVRKKPRKQIMHSPPSSAKSTLNVDQDQTLDENDEEMKDMEVEHEIIKPFLEKIHDLKKLDSEVPLEPNYIANQPQMSLKKRYVSCFHKISNYNFSKFTFSPFQFQEFLGFETKPF